MKYNLFPFSIFKLKMKYSSIRMKMTTISQLSLDLKLQINQEHIQKAASYLSRQNKI